MDESDIDGPIRRISSLKVRDEHRIERAKKTNTDSWIRGTESGKFPLSGRGCVWLGGLLTLALITLSLYQVVPQVEKRLEERTLSELSGAGIETGGLDVDFSWRDGRISGLVATPDAAADVENILTGVEGIRAIEVDLAVAEAPPPTTGLGPSAAIGSVSVIVQFLGDAVSLSGTVLSEDHRASLVGAAELAMGAENVVDRLDVSGLVAEIEGADRRVEALTSVMGQIVTPTRGRIVLVDESLSSSLTVPNEQNRLALAAAFDASGMVGEREIEVDATTPVTSEPEPDAPEPDPDPEVQSQAEQVLELQGELDALQAEIAENVIFDAAQSSLNPTAQLTLDKVADVMDRYPQTAIEVEGHTDSLGVEAENTQLSQERADAVAAYLVAAGVDASRLSAVGYGQDQPIGDNSTNAGRRANRRVQFTAKELSP